MPGQKIGLVEEGQAFVESEFGVGRFDHGVDEAVLGDEEVLPDLSTFGRPGGGNQGVEGSGIEGPRAEHANREPEPRGAADEQCRR